jgi:two-component system sensor histidine kinase UhpB
MPTCSPAATTEPFRILHVEDSPDDAGLVRLALRNAPFAIAYFRVETHADYAAQLDSGTPDVILCDYDLPAFSAERALQLMQERGLDIPFIVLSHHIDEHAAVIAMQQGASDYLSKRDLGRLAKAIAMAIDRRRARADKARAQEELRASESTRRSILNSLRAQIAMIDAQGTILAVNKVWEDFGETRRQLGLRSAGIGDNYLELLDEKLEGGSRLAEGLLGGIREVIARKRGFFALEYPLVIGRATRWYIARALPLEGGESGAVVSHRDITDRMMTHIALDHAHQRLQVLSKRVLNVQEEERRRISRDLHDDVGQSLTALKIGLHRLAQDSTAGHAGLVAECLGIADATLDRLRELALELRPPQLDQLGLAEALGWLVERQRNATGLEIDCHIAGMESRRPPAFLETACYRIAQEALNNATRHANAKRIAVQVDWNGRLLKLRIRDDGVGFDAEAARQRALKSGSLGLISMEERAHLAGGRMKLRSVLGGGTTLSVVFPVNGTASPDAGSPDLPA